MRPSGQVPSRRSFLIGSGLIAAEALATSTLCGLAALTGQVHGAERGQRRDYGPLRPTRDQEGRMVLALPAGFNYVTFSRTGENFGDGLVVPRNHDGMTCFQRSDGLLRLIRNHELRNAAGNFTLGVPVADGVRYDRQGMGGCMTLDFDPKSKRLVRQFPSIGGTISNCAGGLAWKRTGWITCEEATDSPAEGFDKPHGYCFFVPAWVDAASAAVPLRWMGRFRHEAAVADAHGIVYLTEDAGGTSGFYRAVPNAPEDLTRGGTLEMLAIKRRGQANLATGQTAGASLPVEWVSIGMPDARLESGAPRCFTQGWDKGGAAFNRLEGIFLGQDGRSIYFVSTSGGDRGCGQLWQYVPGERELAGDGRLQLVFESPAVSMLDSPDNLCITPNGGVLLCEDDARDDQDTHPLAPGIVEVNRLVGLGREGEPFEFAVNLLNASEFAGACYSPDGAVLFANLFGTARPGSGMTCAIWGPWHEGPL